MSFIVNGEGPSSIKNADGVPLNVILRETPSAGHTTDLPLQHPANLSQVEGFV
jgi:hypothetical protein